MTYQVQDGDVLREATTEEATELLAFQQALLVPTIGDYTSAIAAMLNEKARERRYDDALSIATYVGSANTQWAAEAQAFVAWRDQIWTYCYKELDRVQGAARPQPTVDDFLAELQASFPMTWPAAT